MKRDIKRIKLFPNNNKNSENITNILRKKLESRGYIITDENFDLGIAIGGDGSFLRMIKNSSFNEDVYYLGVNAGTLGFSQDIYPDDLDHFIEKLDNREYKIEKIGVLETEVYVDGGVSKFCSLNEISVRDKDLNTVFLNILINGNLLEKFVGDGVLVSTSFGSTAYNLSFGGSIVYNELHTLQITPVAPLNSKSYHVLRNSVIIPEQRKITIIPEKRTKDLLVSVDGENNFYDNVEKIEASVKRKISFLRMNEYDYTKKINEKFL